MSYEKSHKPQTKAADPSRSNASNCAGSFSCWAAHPRYDNVLTRHLQQGSHVRPQVLNSATG